MKSFSLLRTVILVVSLVSIYGCYRDSTPESNAQLKISSIKMVESETSSSIPHILINRNDAEDRALIGTSISELPEILGLIGEEADELRRIDEERKIEALIISSVELHRNLIATLENESIIALREAPFDRQEILESLVDEYFQKHLLELGFSGEENKP